ncbi:hypothetical protein [Flavihumibacter profundi]|jgi:hypothetical protein|uniref:hypothetical protein n=1 Tax=Flavihumibacter profundi TaxID=2716883 RepID=UPI001CC7ABB5|nr:hypothetical protein [Flavihumibacter profundi]MBZ5857324.1 hypothetical protein [Flavihumibacter profundi]
MKFYVLLFFISFSISCRSRQEFDKAKWSEVGDLMTFPNRNSMLSDLTDNYNLKTMSYSQVIGLLGQPQYVQENGKVIEYDIDKKYGTDIDPVYIKAMTVSFNTNLTVQKVEIKEWRK